MRSTIAPIQAFVGLNGSGKTLGAMALVVLPTLDAGGSCLSTCNVEHPRAELLRSWLQLVDVERERLAMQADGSKLTPMVIFLDEITSSLPSRQAMSLPPQLARMFNQLRKVNVRLVWTAPNWARADKLLREVTSTVTVCKGALPDRWERAENGRSRLRGVDGKSVRAAREWAPNRLFRFRTYSAEDFEEFTLSKTAKLKPVGTSWYLRKRHDAHLRYDTREAVQLLDHVDDGGLCIGCGLSRPRRKCSCPDVAPVEASLAAPVPASAPLEVDDQAVELESVELPSVPDLELVRSYGFSEALRQATEVEAADSSGFWNPASA